jgi:hypothetical protein
LTFIGFCHYFIDLALFIDIALTFFTRLLSLIVISDDLTNLDKLALLFLMVFFLFRLLSSFIVVVGGVVGVQV